MGLKKKIKKIKMKREKKNSVLTNFKNEYACSYFLEKRGYWDEEEYQNEQIIKHDGSTSLRRHGTLSYNFRSKSTPDDIAATYKMSFDPESHEWLACTIVEYL